MASVIAEFWYEYFTLLCFLHMIHTHHWLKYIDKEVAYVKS